MVVARADHEPEAAAVAAGALVGIYDLGGGTFDATVLTKTATGFELLGRPAGDPELGGVDFDQLVLGHIRAGVGQCWPAAADDPATRQALTQVRSNAVDAKEALSVDTEARVAVILPDCAAEVRLTRAEFEAAVREPLQRSVEVFRQVLRDADVEPQALHAVLLTGGSSRIPLVAELLTNQLGVQVSSDAHPKFAVCLGAAITAGTHLLPASEPAATTPAPAPAPAPAALASAREAVDVDLTTSGLTRAADVPLPPPPAGRSLGPPVPRITDEDLQPLVVHLGAPAQGGWPWLAPLLIVAAVLLVIAAFVAFVARSV